MASGGFQPNKQGKPEPKRRSNWHRSVSSDRDDAQSLNSLPSDIRINNWDLSDLWPTNLGGDSKRRKKSKGNPEREREQSLSVDSPPHDQRQHTPSSYPRTKLASGTPTSQQVALENLKQHMTFSDMDDQVSTDGERNNERQVPQSHRRRLNPTDSENDARARHNNRNNNMDFTNSRDQETDSNEVIARLMQIRDFMKQARSMLDSMERLGDRKKMEDIEKVRRLIRNLQEQEQGYRGLLQNTLQVQTDAGDERSGAQAQVRPGMKAEVKDDSDDDTSVDLEVKTENSETSENSQESRPRIESKLGMESEGEDDQRDLSGLQISEPLLGASAGAQANTSDNATRSRSPDMENSLMPRGLRVPMQESTEGSQAPADSESMSLHHQELLKILREKQQQLQALMGRQEELNLKRRETEKKLLQAQARDNKARAALSAVSAGRQIVEKRLATHQAQSLLDAVSATSAAQAVAAASAVSEALEAVAWDRGEQGEDDGDDQLDVDDEEAAAEDEEEEKGAIGESRVLKSNIVGYPESDDEDNSNVRELGAVASLPNDLQELKRQLNFLRNEFSLVSEAPKNVSSNSADDDGRQQLENKLEELQSKRSGINKLLQDLQRIHAQPLELLQNNDSSMAQEMSSSQTWRPRPSNISTSRQQQEPLPPPPPPPPQVRQHQHLQEQQLPLHPLLANLPTSSGASGGPSLPPNLQASMNDMAAPTSSAVDSAMATFARLAAEGSDQQEASASMDPLMVSEVQEKLRRLKEVRGQLDQLRSLVQYYQDQRDELEPIDASRPSASQAEQGRTPLPMVSEVHNTRSSQEQEADPSAQLEVFLQQQQRKQPPSRQADESGALGGMAGAASFQNMAQLLNLAGTDQADDHSDEENASVSQSESQWSHLGPWDDDPEIQEKVKKLRAAKEKLRQLQDLVAFVQQSPDAARALPDNLGDIANSTEEGEGEAVSQATQTDEPNASVSEGEALSDSNQHMQQRGDNTDGLDSTRAELERLRKERAMLLDIQSQLKQIQDQTEGTSVDRGRERQERRDEQQNGDLVKPGQTSNAPVVTFASNDELYSKMRRQRILREELRSKKKELEAIMKKDRNKRQYSRNQDNQSDTVSLNTDTFGIPASVDATMATWGGSTVDNLENITEDEDGGQERNERPGREEDEEDDGYPSDGIVQVEEEEEENDSDNGTYTIEADARQRRSHRTGPGGASGGMGIGARPKTSRGRQTYPQPSYPNKNTKKLPKKNCKRAKGNQRDYRLKQENFRSAEELIEENETPKIEDSKWFQQIQERLSTLSSSIEVLLRKSDSDSRQLSVSLSQENAPQGASLISPMQEQLLQLQNQSMMLSFGQVVQSLARQQGDMHQLQQQLQNLQLQVQEVHEQSFQGALGSSGSHMFRPTLTNTPLNNSSYNLQASAAAAAQSLSFNQQMPSPFTQAGLNNTAPGSLLGGLSPGLRSLQHQTPGLGLSTGNLSNGGVGGAGGLSISTVASSVTPSAPGFVFNPMSHSTLGQPAQPQQLQHHNFSYNRQQAASTSSLFTPHQTQDLSTGTGMATRDFSHVVNCLQQSSSPGPDGMLPDQMSRAFKVPQTSSEGGGLNFSSLFPTSTPFLSTRDMKEEQEESPVPTHLTSSGRNKKRKYGCRVKRSETEHSTGPRMSTARSEPMDGGESTVWSLARSPGSQLGGAGAGAGFDANSSYSSIQSIREQHSRLRTEQTQAKSVDESEENNTLFETLRDTIYTEVASLISQNESRPHFLLELFRDIRQVDSDLMRQRTLYALDDLLKSGLKETKNFRSPNASWVKAETANSEQTPSESMTSEDDEDLKVTRLQEEITAAERNRLNRLTRGSGSLRGYPFDYAELADNPSSLSTPTNGADDAPFFQDTLGETVIRFDMLRSEEAERAASSKGKSKGQGSVSTSQEAKTKPRWGEGGFLASEQLLKDMRCQLGSGAAHRAADEVEEEEEGGQTRWRMRFGAGSGVLASQESQSSEVASSSAMDQASESSMSDMPYPRIDMKQLDRQIKAIMLETIPVVKEHMEDVCSGQLLAYIKRLVLSLTGQMGSQDFARFFHRQLASILEDTLQKYHGRKMRECGEDLLVEISDVLFNELAFFRLMQDLDDPNVASRLRNPQWQDQATVNKEGSDYSGGSSSSSSDEDNNDEAGGKKSQRRNRDVKDKDGDAIQRGFLITEADQDEMGRERDDELASQVRVDDTEEKDEDETEHSYKIELAPSETKPFTRIGSDEDDDEGDEEQSMEDPSETAVSRDSMLETNNTVVGDRQQQVGPSAPSSASPKPSGPADAGGQSSEASGGPRPETEGSQGDGAEKQDREKPVGGPSSSPAKVNGEREDTPGAGVNGLPNHTNDVDDDKDNELTVDDLPDRLDVGVVAADTSIVVNNVNNNITSTNSPELRQMYEEEQLCNTGLQALLDSLDGTLELAGDGTLISSPDGFLS